jgi:hypothetical protein
MGPSIEAYSFSESPALQEKIDGHPSIDVRHTCKELMVFDVVDCHNDHGSPNNCLCWTSVGCCFDHNTHHDV